MSIFDSNFYVQWRQSRFNFIVKTLGKDFFEKKNVLELGCAEGDLGNMFNKTFGCSVTCLEGRPENIEKGKQKFPHLTFVRFDADEDMDKWDAIVPSEKYDIILNLGLLYHTLNVNKQLMECLRRTTSCFILETEILDFNKPALLFQYEGVSHSCVASSLETGPCKNHLTRASISWIENVFRDYNQEVKHLHSITCSDMEKQNQEKEKETTIDTENNQESILDSIVAPLSLTETKEPKEETKTDLKTQINGDEEKYSLQRLIKSFERHQDGSMNCPPFIYDWTPTGSSLKGGLRSLWIVKME